MSKDTITLAEGTIHNPDEHRHFMTLTPMTRRVRIARDGLSLAETTSAIRLLEVGYKMYPPVIYLPAADISVSLTRTARVTHCPLKGDCFWYSADVTEGSDIAWSYENTFAFAQGLQGLVAFDADRVAIEEEPLSW
ncbi:MAG: DUF427 domain-containing protein [Pseudomonadota bacterium]